MIFMKKEILRVITDKKLIFSLFIMPIFLMIGIFSLIGYLSKSMTNDIKTHIGSVYIQNSPEKFNEFLSTVDLNSFNINYIDGSNDTQEIKQQIKSGNTDLLIVFEDNFIDKIINYNNEANLPQIKTFYNESEDYSSSCRKEFLQKIIEPFRNVLLTERFGDINKTEIFGIDTDNPESIIQDDKKAQGKALGMMMPYMITILLFASVMSICVDAIAGEKERGTMAILLLTPVSRKNIILGKISGLTLLSILSALVYGISSAIGILINSSDTVTGLSISFSFVQIIQMLITILLMATNYVSIVALLSSLCNNVKEASTYIMPVYMIVIVSGILTMFGNGTPELVQYCIPIYGSSLVLKDIFAMEITSIGFLLSSVVSITLTCIVVFIITKVFDNEKIMFNS